MDILHLIDHWGLGGAQRALVSLIRHDSENRHFVTAVFGHGRFGWPLPETHGPEFLADGLGQMPAAVLRLRRLVLRARPDLLHVHLTGSRFIAAMSLIGMKHKPQIVWHEHSGLEPLQIYGSIRGKALMGVQRHLVKRVAGVIANSHATAEHCRQWLRVPDSRLTVVHCGVDSEEILAQSRQNRADLPEPAATDDPIIGFVGRLAPQKGPDEFLRLAAELAPLCPRGRFWLVGGGRRTAELERLAAVPELAGKVAFWGSREDVYRLMARMAVVVMPSRYEPFGLVAVEAMVLGIPVAAYAVDGLAEILADQPLAFAAQPGQRASLLIKTLEALDNRGNPDRDISYRNPYEAKEIKDHWNQFYWRILRERT